MEWRGVLLAVAFTFGCLFYAAPGFAMRAADSVIKYAPYSYVFTVVSAGLWAIYGADWGLVPLCCVSVVGVLLGTVYCFLFLWRSDPADPRFPYLLRFTLGGATLFAVAVGYDIIWPKSVVYGMICSAAACFASAAPLYNAPRAFRESRMDGMPSLFIPAFAFPNAIFWTVRNTTLKGVGWKEVDYNLVVSTCVAALCALAQLILHARARFWRAPPPPPPPPTGLAEHLLKKGGAEGAPAAATPVAADNIPQPPPAVDPPAVHVPPA